ncbi:MAG: hypothetical protein QW594_02735, partial [Candidatus Woesearchaeota archaeon]
MCSICGVIVKSKNRKNDPSVLSDLEIGLTAMQHRGEESSGVALFRWLPMSRDTYRLNRAISLEDAVNDYNPMTIIKGKGKISTILESYILEQKEAAYKEKKTFTIPEGFMGIGHGRYPTSSYTLQKGQTKEEYISKGMQPLVAPWNKVAFVHNGDIHNYQELREAFTKKKIRFVTTNDLEALACVFNEAFFSQAEMVEPSLRIENTIRT